MKVVLDNNTVVSGLLWHGHSRRILDLAREGSLSLYTSTTLLAELDDVLTRAKFATRLARIHGDAKTLSEGYLTLAETVEPTYTPQVVKLDPDDDRVLACALAVGADYIISGDRHLLDLGNYEDIPILNAADFLAVYQAASQSSN